MEGENEKYYAEWIYENFSCWNSEIHGNRLYYAPCHSNLYPRGLSGGGDHLVVKVWDSNDSSKVELSYIGADGSLICKQEVHNPEWKEHFLILPAGPKFEEAVGTRKNKDLQKDIITLKLYRSDYKGAKYRGFTKIDVQEGGIKMPVFMFKGIQLGKSSWISKFSFKNGNKIYDWDLNARLVGLTLDNAQIVFEFFPNFKEKLLIHANVSLLDNNGVAIKSEENKQVFTDKKMWTFPGILRRKEMMQEGFYLILRLKFISGDKQDAYFTTSFKYIGGHLPTKSIASSKNSTENLTSEDLTAISSDTSVTVLSKELMCLYQDQDFSDFQLKCGDVSLPVHRGILSARSPVFKTMLSCDMREAASGCMDIEDLDPSTLTRFLAFLYTGTIEDLQGESALKLYYAADKYQVPSLKRECVSVLCAEVSISNVCDILSLADKHQDDKLTSVAHDFILKNYKAVLSSEKWKNLMAKEALLCAETLTQFAERNRVGEINN